jgi:hypothetical protein
VTAMREVVFYDGGGGGVLHREVVEATRVGPAYFNQVHRRVRSGELPSGLLDANGELTVEVSGLEWRELGALLSEHGAIDASRDDGLLAECRAGNPGRGRADEVAEEEGDG